MDAKMIFARCSTCLLPTNIPGLTFDQDGKCNICQDFSSHQFDDSQKSLVNSKREFEAIIKRIKGRGKYD